MQINEMSDYRGFPLYIFLILMYHKYRFEMDKWIKECSDLDLTIVRKPRLLKTGFNFEF